MWCSGTVWIVRRWHITQTAFIDHRPNFNATSLLELETNTVLTFLLIIIQKRNGATLLSLWMIPWQIPKAVSTALNAELFCEECHGRDDDMHVKTLLFLIASYHDQWMMMGYANRLSKWWRRVSILLGIFEFLLLHLNFGWKNLWERSEEDGLTGSSRLKDCSNLNNRFFLFLFFTNMVSRIKCVE